MALPYTLLPVLNSNNLTFYGTFGVGDQSYTLNLDTGSTLLWIPANDAECTAVPAGDIGTVECASLSGKTTIVNNAGGATTDVILNANYGVGRAYGRLVEDVRVAFGDISVDMALGVAEQVVQAHPVFFDAPMDGLIGLGMPYNVWTCTAGICADFETADLSCQICSDSFTEPIYAGHPIGGTGLATQRQTSLIQQMVETYGGAQMNIYIPMVGDSTLSFGDADPSRYKGEMEWVDVYWPFTESSPDGYPGYWQFALGSGPWGDSGIAALDSGASFVLFDLDVFNAWLLPALAKVPGIRQIQSQGFPAIYHFPVESIPELPTLSIPIGNRIFNLTGAQYVLTEPSNIQALLLGQNATIPDGEAVARIAGFAGLASTGLTILLGSPFLQWHYSSYLATNDTWITGNKIGVAKLATNDEATAAPTPQPMPTTTGVLNTPTTTGVLNTPSTTGVQSTPPTTSATSGAMSRPRNASFVTVLGLALAWALSNIILA